MADPINVRKTSNDLAIVIMSCDNYSDIWQPFADCWEKFWPQCPYPTYLISETKSFNHPQIGNIQTGKRMQWGEMLLFVLDRIDTPYVLYLQEDYLLRAPVDETKIIRLMDLVKTLDAAYLRLLPWPPPDKPHPKYDGIGVLEKEVEYRTSLQAAIWNKNILKTLILPEDNGWVFEHESVKRSQEVSNIFLSLNRNHIDPDINKDGSYPFHYYATPVFQGKWLKEAIRIYKSLGINIDTSHRGVMNRIDFLEYQERKNGTKSISYRAINTVKQLIDFLRELV